MPAEAAPSFVLVPELPPPGERVVLARAESHYLSRVCRARAGDQVRATDGRGGEALLRLLRPGDAVEAEGLALERSERKRQAWICCGAPEGARADWLVEKLAELGVGTFQPISCARAAWGAPAAKRERWRRLAVAALRQSRQRFLMEIRAPVAIGEAIAGLPAEASRWLGEPEGRAASALPGPGSGLAVAAIGPAGGFTADERAALAGAGFVPIAFGRARLRAETAALAWAAWWASAGG